MAHKIDSTKALLSTFSQTLLHSLVPPKVFVNYVWINPEKDTATNIPSHLFYRVQQNAAQYPDAFFQVWVESPSVCDLYDIPSNVCVRKLDSISSISSNSIMALTDPRTIWAKADLARLFVLQHCLRDSRCKVAVYSDLDVPDVLIKSEEFRKRITTYGVALGGVIEPHTGKISAPYENGYAAFSKKGGPILEHMVGAVVKTMGRVQPTYYTGRDSVFLDVRHALADWSRDHYNNWATFWQDLAGGLPVLNPMGFRGDTHLVAKPGSSSGYTRRRPAKFFGKSRKQFPNTL